MIILLFNRSCYICRQSCTYRTEDKQKRGSHFFKIHDYLQQICDESHLQGLKYYGGPEASCKCKGPKSEQISRILRFAEYSGEKGICERKTSIKCKKCFKEFKLDEVLDLQVSQSCFERLGMGLRTRLSSVSFH